MSFMETVSGTTARTIDSSATDGGRPLITIVVATLLRLGYPSLVQSIRSQSYRNFELHARAEPEVNEYVSRNRAVKEAKGLYVYFTDDDCVMQPRTLEIAAKWIEENERPPALGGPLQGNMFGSGEMRLDQPNWGVGANMVIRADVFREIGGFEEDWGLGHPVKGWRADTDIWWRIEDKYPGYPLWAPDLVIHHPNPMGSVWQPEVEDVFFRRWRQKTLARLMPVDPRMQQFLLETQELTTEERTDIIKARRASRKMMPAIPVLPQEAEVPV